MVVDGPVWSYRWIMAETGRLIARDWKYLAIVFLLLTSAYSAIDLSLEETDALAPSFVLSVFAIYTQLLATYRALRSYGLVPADYDRSRPTHGRFAGYFVQGLMYGLCIFAGLLLLVVPGALLIIGWAVAGPALAAEDLSASESLSRSWMLTKGRRKLVAAVVGTMVVFWIVLLAIIVPLMLVEQIGAVELILFNVILSCSIATWFPGIAMCRCLVNEEHRELVKADDD